MTAATDFSEAVESPKPTGVRFDEPVDIRALLIFFAVIAGALLFMAYSIYSDIALAGARGAGSGLKAGTAGEGGREIENGRDEDWDRDRDSDRARHDRLGSAHRRSCSARPCPSGSIRRRRLRVCLRA